MQVSRRVPYSAGPASPFATPETRLYTSEASSHA